MAVAESNFSWSGAMIMPEGFKVEFIGNPPGSEMHNYMPTTGNFTATPEQISKFNDALNNFSIGFKEVAVKMENVSSSVLSMLAGHDSMASMVSESPKLDRTFKCALLPRILLAVTGESIWTLGEGESMQVLHLHRKSKAKATLYTSKGSSTTSVMWTPSKALKKGWTKVAEGYSEDLLPAIPKKIHSTGKFDSYYSYDVKTFMYKALNVFNDVAGYYSALYNGGWGLGAAAEGAEAYRSIEKGKEKFLSSLTPAQKGKLTTISKQLQIFVAYSKLSTSTSLTSLLNSAAKTKTEIPAEAEVIIDLAQAYLSNVIPFGYYSTAIAGHHNKLVVARNLATLPFDLDEVDYPTLKNFVISCGLTQAELVSFEGLKIWLKGYIGIYPNSVYNTLHMNEVIEYAKNNEILIPIAEKATKAIAQKVDSSLLLDDDPIFSSQELEATLGVSLPKDAIVTQHPSQPTYRVYSSITPWVEYTSGKDPVILENPYALNPRKAQQIDVSGGWEMVCNNGSNPFVKPAYVSDFAWNLVFGSEFGGKDFAKIFGGSNISEEAVLQNIIGADVLNWGEKLLILAATEPIKMLVGKALIEWNSSVQAQFLYSEIVTVVKHLATEGAYITPDTPTWYCEALNKDLVVPFGAKVYTYANKIFIDVGSPFIFGVFTSGDTFISQPSLKSAKLVFIAPPSMSIDRAWAEGWEFSEASFAKVLEAEKQAVWTLDFPEDLAAYKFKLALANLNDPKPYEGIVSKVYALPPGVKELVINCAQESNTDCLDVVVWRLSKKAYAGELLQLKIDPATSYYSFINTGMITAGDIETAWPLPAVADFIKDHHVVCDPEGSKAHRAAAIAEKILEIKKTAGVEAAADASQDTANLNLTGIEKSFGGMHTKKVYADQLGIVWMAKFYASDALAQYRCDAEHYGNVIGRTLGFGNPQTFVRTIDGQYNILQRIEDNNGTLKNVMPGDLNLSQLTDVMKEHVLDWLISNHDSWGDNLLLHPDGSHIIGIDKGQAFKHCHDDKLAIGYLPRENPIPVWYDFFYSGVINHTISEDVARAVTSKVLLKAYQVKISQDQRIRSLLEAALNKRTMWPVGHTKESYIELIMARKADILDDFAALYKDIFEQAGLAWTIDIEQFGQNIGNAFISNSPLFAERVRKASGFGLPLFFHSLDLEDAHVLFTPMQQMGGGICLLGAAKIRENADVALTKWLKARLGEGLESKPYKSKYNTSAELPHLNTFVDYLIAYAKTLKTHKHDKMYNEEIIQQAMAYASSIELIKNNIEAMRKKQAHKVVSQFTTLEQQDTWYSYASTLLEYYKQIAEAKSFGKAVKDIYPNFPKLSYFTYVPSKGLDNNVNAKAKEEIQLPDSVKIVATTDGGFYKLTDAGISWLSADEFADLTKQKIEKSVESSNEVEQDVQIAGKQMQVARRSALLHGGVLDLPTGKLIEKSDSLSAFQTGNEYVVSYGQVKIFYRPWFEDGVKKAQQGHLTFEIRNWDGDHAAIDDVLDTLSLMGICVNPADASTLELFYWRHLTNVLRDRKLESKTANILKTVDKALTSAMTSDQELNILKDAWAKAYSKDMVDNANWMPMFSRYYGQLEGRPHWYRPDASLEDLKKYYKKDLPIHSIYRGQSGTAGIDHLISILLSGRLLSTEERPRILGVNVHGASSSADQGHGSSAFVFSRQNRGYHEGSNPTLLLDPRVALRTHTYAFPGDNYGEIANRKDESPFAPASMYTLGKGGQSYNEMMIKNEAPFLAVIVYDSSSKSTVIKKLKEAGVNEINGTPLESFIYNYSEFSADSANIINSLWERAHKAGTTTSEADESWL